MATTKFTCTTHNVESVTRQGNYGPWEACPGKMPDGSFCRYKPAKAFTGRTFTPKNPAIDIVSAMIHRGDRITTTQEQQKALFEVQKWMTVVSMAGSQGSIQAPKPVQQQTQPPIQSNSFYPPSNENIEEVPFPSEPPF